MTILFFTIWTISSFPQTRLRPKEINDKWSYVDTTGQIIFTTDYDYVCDFHDNIARVKKNEKWGYIDTTGKIIVPLLYDWAMDFQEDYGIVNIFSKGCFKKSRGLIYKLNCRQKCGIIDTTGYITMTKYDYITCFKDGYAKVFNESWWDLIWKNNIDWKKIDKNFVEYDIPE
jgi:hypothetical protein